MAILHQVLLIVLPVFLVIGLGFGLKRTDLLAGTFLNQLNRLVFYVALPALLFYKIATADFKASFNGALLFGLLASLLITFAVSYGYGLLRKYPSRRLGAFCQGAFRGNLAYVGLAVIFYAYGEEGFATAGILLGFLVPAFNFLSVLALLLPQKRSDHSMSAAFWMYQFIFNPLIIASFAGIVWSFLELPLPLVFDRMLKIITGMALPLALLAIGASFSPKKLQGDIVVAALATTIKIVVLPLLAASILIFLGVGGKDLGIGVIFAGTPTATAAYIMAGQLKSDAELSGSIIMLSTLFSLVTFTVSLYLLSSFNL